MLTVLCTLHMLCTLYILHFIMSIDPPPPLFHILTHTSQYSTRLSSPFPCENIMASCHCQPLASPALSFAHRKSYLKTSPRCPYTSRCPCRFPVITHSIFVTFPYFPAWRRWPRECGHSQISDIYHHYLMPCGVSPGMAPPQTWQFMTSINRPVRIKEAIRYV